MATTFSSTRTKTLLLGSFPYHHPSGRGPHHVKVLRSGGASSGACSWSSSTSYASSVPLSGKQHVLAKPQSPRSMVTFATMEKSSIEKDDAVRSISEQIHVAMKLATQLISTESKDSNMVFSPLSLLVLISLIANGAKGSTLDQILSFFKSESTEELNKFYADLLGWVFKDGSASGGPQLSVANGVWVDESLSLKDSFKKLVEGRYKASVDIADFQNKAVEVIKEVNAWAENETRGLIKQVLPPDSVDSMTRLILANAIYFKGTWRQRFQKSWTKNYDFYLQNGGSVNVPFMTSRNDQFVCAFDSFKVLRLPYRQGQDDRQFSMCFFLPNEKEGLPALLEKIGSESGFLDQHLPPIKVEVGAFRLPKFKVSFGFEASDALMRLGLTLGDFTEMVNTSEGEEQELYVSSIVQKAFIEVNEEGTEAAAVSIMEMCCTGVRRDMPDPIEFVADHPFLFLIREDSTGLVMFFGQVLNPIAT